MRCERKNRTPHRGIVPVFLEISLSSLARIRRPVGRWNNEMPTFSGTYRTYRPHFAT